MDKIYLPKGRKLSSEEEEIFNNMPIGYHVNCRECIHSLLCVHYKRLKEFAGEVIVISRVGSIEIELSVKLSKCCKYFTMFHDCKFCCFYEENNDKCQPKDFYIPVPRNKLNENDFCWHYEMKSSK